MTDEILKLMKDVAIAFEIKCSKYHRIDLTPELRDTLFKEALKEVLMMNNVNNDTLRNISAEV